jgi:carboxypeptidase C (cathepsin A)
LVGFLDKYAEYKDRDVYLTGESFAGHYIPVFANHIFFNPVDGFNLAGIAMGNAWVDPFYQYPAYAEFAMENDLIKYSHYYATVALYSLCQMSLIIRVPIVSTYICQLAGITIASPLPMFNVYDIREPCVTVGLCYPDDKLDQVLNSDEYAELMFTGAGHETPSSW